MATPEERDELRRRLAEEIPTDGVEEDTLFTDERLDQLLDENGSVEASLGEGWEEKAGLLANLTRVQEGSSIRDLSALHKNAINMARLHGSGNATQVPIIIQPPRLGKIKRPGFQG